MSRILLFLFLFPSCVFAYQIAYIKESRALVFADQELKVPIGFLSKGKKIKVGEVKRNGGQALPVIVAGKIVFIKVDDLAFKDVKTDQYATTENEHFVEEEKEEEDLVEPIRLRMDLEFMDPGPQWDELMSLTGGTNKPMIQIEALMELRLTQSPFFFDAGFIYSILDREGEYTFSALGFKILAQYRLFNFQLLDLDLNAGFHIAPGGAKLKYEGVYDDGNYWGYLLGAQVRFLPRASWNINLGVNYNIIAVNELDDIPLPQGNFVLNRFEGFAIYFGASFQL